jgi:two-component system OmpR family response regulator
VPVPISCRVLVVDDHPDSAESLARVIEMLGHEARFLTNATQVEGLVADFKPHVLLLDIAMPRIDGWSLARELRKQYPPEALKIVAVTAFDAADAHISSRKAGFDAHVAKPIDEALLQKILEQCFTGGLRLPPH